MARKKDYLPISDPRFKFYHDSYDRHRLDSQILNGGGRRPSVYDRDYGSLSGIKAGIFELEGSTTEKNNCLKTYLENEEQKVYTLLQQRKKTQIAEGNALPDDPDEMFWTTELKEKLFNVQARQDIMTEEIFELKKRLREFKKKEEEREPLLPYGPRGSTRLHGGVPVVVDGQKVEMIKGVPVIVDDRSPYNGMAIAHYKKHVLPAFNESQRELDAERLKSVQEEARKKGLPVPQTLGVSAGVRVPRSRWPQWPEGVVNYLEKVKDEEANKMKRTNEKQGQETHSTAAE